MVYINLIVGFIVLKLGKRLIAVVVLRGKGRNGLIFSDGCKGGVGGRIRVGRVGFWYVLFVERRVEGVIRDMMYVKIIKVFFEIKRLVLWVIGKNKIWSVLILIGNWLMSRFVIR